MRVWSFTDILRVSTASMLCASALPAQADVGVFDLQTVEFPNETRALVEATSQFFDTVEKTEKRVNRVPVVRIPNSVLKIAADPKDGANLLQGRGPVQHLTGYRINWYPVDKMLGAVDFMGTWDGNRNLVCGYLTWDLTDPDAPVLEDVNATFVELDDLAKGTPEEIHAALLSANCAFGAVDANYAFFDPTG